MSDSSLSLSSPFLSLCFSLPPSHSSRQLRSSLPDFMSAGGSITPSFSGFMTCCLCSYKKIAGNCCFGVPPRLLWADYHFNDYGIIRAITSVNVSNVSNTIKAVFIYIAVAWYSIIITLSIRIHVLYYIFIFIMFRRKLFLLLRV